MSKLKALEAFKPSERIEANRLVLIKRSHLHDDDIWEGIDCHRAYLREYLFWVDSTKFLSDVWATTDDFDEQWDKDGQWTYVIYSLEDNRFLGCIGVFNIDFMSQSAEIGYWLHEDENGHGYMTEAVYALDNELFNLGLHRLVITTDEFNEPSQHVAERCDYALEARLTEAIYHRTGLHTRHVYAKFSPYPIKGFEE